MLKRHSIKKERKSKRLHSFVVEEVGMKLNMVKQVQGQCKKQSVLHMLPIRGQRYPVLSYDFCFIG